MNSQSRSAVTRVVIVADFRSPHALGWVRALTASTLFEVYAVSTHFCIPPNDVKSFHTVPLDFAWLKVLFRRIPWLKSSLNRVTSIVNVARNTELRYTNIFAQIDKAAPKLRRLIENINPDVVHALRIPFEGILTARSVPSGIPLVLSVWGNDFTLFGEKDFIGTKISESLMRADALHTDAHRDINLASSFGFDLTKPSAVFPANGGVDLYQCRSDEFTDEICNKLGIAKGADIVINPRGVSPYIQTENFLRALPICLRARPGVIFVLIAAKHATNIHQLVKELKVECSVRLVDYVTPDILRAYYRVSKIMVSPSDHDGTPITLLESMASGCFPVVSDLPSIREWIVNGENGLLIDARSVESIASGILEALRNNELRSKAAIINQHIIEARASREIVAQEIIKIYRAVISCTA